MSETQLSIIISVLNDAASQLSEVGGQLESLATQATEASEQITSGLNASETAFAEAAQAAAAQWGEMAAEIDGSVSETATAAKESFMSISDSALAAANASSEAWQASIQALQEEMSAADAEIVEGATAAGEKAGSAAAEGFGGYFKDMIVGYGLEQIGSALSGGIESAIANASKSTDQIAKLKDEIQQQRAQILVNEAALQKWFGTTAEVGAAHAKAAADIQAEKEKIVELTQQLAPLQAAHEGLAGSIQNIVGEVLQWIESHKQIENELQTFMTTLGPILTAIGAVIIAITLWNVAMSALGVPILLLIGAGVTIAALTTVWTTFHTQIVGFFDDLNAKTGVITTLKQAWDSVVTQFNNNLKPALGQLWTALQPLSPYIKDLAEVAFAALIETIKILVPLVAAAVNNFTGWLTIATQIASFFTNVLVGAIHSVGDALNTIFNSASFKAVSGLVGSAVSAGSGILNSVSAAIPKFASGGIVNSPTLALVGEAGPEAIIPLSAFSGGSSLSGAGIGGGGGNIVVNINGGSYLDQNGATTIANALARSIIMQLKLKNFY